MDEVVIFAHIRFFQLIIFYMHDDTRTHKRTQEMNAKIGTT